MYLLSKDQQTLSEFFDGLSFRTKLLSEYKKAMAGRLADDFNVFNYISPNETTLSAILAMLLDPNGEHGQGAEFLRIWLRILATKFVNHNVSEHWHNYAQSVDLTSIVKVSTESPTFKLPNSARRMDIRIDIGISTIVIENKFGAADQENQVRDYIEQLEREQYANTTQGMFALIYLSNGSPPTELSILTTDWDNHVSSGKAVMFDYFIDIIDWLKLSMRICEAEKIRWFLRDFINYLENCSFVTNQEP